MNTSHENTPSTHQPIDPSTYRPIDPATTTNRLRIDRQVLQDDIQRYHNKLTHIHTLTAEQRQDYSKKLELAEEEYQKLTQSITN
jgi:hypothetical protein